MVDMYIGSCMTGMNRKRFMGEWVMESAVGGGYGRWFGDGAGGGSVSIVGVNRRW